MKETIKFLFVNYLRLLTKIKLKTKFNGKIIVVAGCYGKSSAVTLLENIFKYEYNVLTSNVDGKGLNSETGIPFIILGVKPKGYSAFDWIKYLIQATIGVFKNINQNLLILELGVDKPNDMKFLTSFIIPNSAILVNSNNSHAANFEDLQNSTNKSFEELISYENGFIFETAKDAIFYNLDDPEVLRQIPRFKGNQQNTFGFSLVKELCIKSWKTTLQGTEMQINYKGKVLHIKHPEPILEEYKNTIEMAVKVSEYYNLPDEIVVRGIQEFNLPPGRCSLFEGKNESKILDSSYNSSLVPASAAIRLTGSLSKGRKIGILGDMRELGVLTEKEHRKLAHFAKECLDIVITVGPAMKDYFADEFKKVKSKEQTLYSFDKTKDALAFISKENYKFVKKDDLILVKGSQNTLLLEIIVEDLLVDKDDTKRLCRRGVFYDKEREKLLA